MSPAGNSGDEAVRELIERALAEDVGSGDWTTLWTVPEGVEGDAVIVAKESLVIAGAELLVRVFAAVDPEVRVELLATDGTSLAPEEAVARIRGPARALLTAERTALNVLGRLTGIATLTNRFVNVVSGTGARIVDTRKTTPGWRRLEKAAVRAGGGSNHRMGLYDMILIKDNHIAAAGGIGPALARVRKENRAGLPVEIEVSTLDQLEEALAGKPDRILLDNMSLDALREAVRHVGKWRSSSGGGGTGERRAPELEASGNMTLDRVRAVAETGVDFISVGALTHSAPSADLSMRMRQPRGRGIRGR